LKFNKECETFIKSLKNQDVCILGDININLSKPNESKSKYELKYENLAPQFGMEHMITIPTRNDSCLDMHII
jgi:hypothetical protein